MTTTDLTADQLAYLRWIGLGEPSRQVLTRRG